MKILHLCLMVVLCAVQFTGLGALPNCSDVPAPLHPRAFKKVGPMFIKKLMYSSSVSDKELYAKELKRCDKWNRHDFSTGQCRACLDASLGVFEFIPCKDVKGKTKSVFSGCRASNDPVLEIGCSTNWKTKYQVISGKLLKKKIESASGPEKEALKIEMKRCVRPWYKENNKCYECKVGEKGAAKYDYCPQGSKFGFMLSGCGDPPVVDNTVTTGVQNFISGADHTAIVAVLQDDNKALQTAHDLLQANYDAIQNEKGALQAEKDTLQVANDRLQDAAKNPIIEEVVDNDAQEEEITTGCPTLVYDSKTTKSVTYSNQQTVDSIATFVCQDGFVASEKPKCLEGRKWSSPKAKCEEEGVLSKYKTPLIVAAAVGTVATIGGVAYARSGKTSARKPNQSKKRRGRKHPKRARRRNEGTDENADAGENAEAGENADAGENAEAGEIADVGENAEVGENIAESGENAPEAGENAAEAGENAAETGENAAEASENVAEAGENAGAGENAELGDNAELNAGNGTLPYFGNSTIPDAANSTTTDTTVIAGFVGVYPSLLISSAIAAIVVALF